MKAVNTKLVVLMICGKINQQQKIAFNIRKQLNGPVLKSLKPSFLGRFSGKKNGRVGFEISISLLQTLTLDLFIYIFLFFSSN